MTGEQQRLDDYLGHIIEAIERIFRYTSGMSQPVFLHDALVQDAVIRNFEVLGEASRNIATRFPAFAALHPELRLADAYQMRNVLAHGYFKVDFEIVWKTVQGDLGNLLGKVQKAQSTVRRPRTDEPS